MNQLTDGGTLASGESDLRDSLEPSTEELSELEVQVEEAQTRTTNGETLSGFERYEQVFDHKLLSYEKTIELGKLKDAGNINAREKLILHNLRLVKSIAKMYLGLGLDELDVYQEGMIGLMKGVDKWEYQRGFRLSTYVSWWIRRSIRRAISNHGQDIRLPVHEGDKRRKVRNVAAELEVKFGRKPTLEEIQKGTGFGLRVIEDSFSMAGTVMFSIHDVIDHGDGETERGNTIADTRSPNPFEALTAQEGFTEVDEKTTTLLKVLPTLSFGPRDIEVFKLLYGLNGSKVQIPLTLELVASQFNLTRERIRQIIAKIWKKLERRNPDWLPVLRALEARLGKFSSANGSDQKRAKKERLTKSSATGSGLNGYFRASPAFARWNPDENHRENHVQACFAFVGMAYEIKISEILSPKPRKLARWTQCLSIYLMSEELSLTGEAITAHVTTVRGSSIRGICGEVETAIKSNAFVRRDIEMMQAHFRKVMNLQ